MQRDKDKSFRMGTRIFAVAVFETNSVTVAATMLMIKLTITGEKLPKIFKLCASHVDKPVDANVGKPVNILLSNKTEHQKCHHQPTSQNVHFRKQAIVLLERG